MPKFGDYDTPPENTDFQPGSRIESNEIDANYDKIEVYLNSDFVDDDVIADDAINGSKITDDSIVGSDKLTAGSVTVDKLDPALVTPIPGVPNDNSVTSAKIVDDSIVDADVNSAADIAGSKLADDSILAAKLDADAAPGRLIETIVRSTPETNTVDITTAAGYTSNGFIEAFGVGGGGAGGGCGTTGATAKAMGAFGGGGAYAEICRVPISTLSSASALPFTVGAGGVGANHTDGTDGGFTSLDTNKLVAPGGQGGMTMAGGTNFDSQVGGRGGGDTNDPAFLPAAVGDVTSPGNAGENATRIVGSPNAEIIPQGTSGDGYFGGAVRAAAVDADGNDGLGFGSGGSGGRNSIDNGGTQRAGGNGSGGILVIKVYA